MLLSVYIVLFNVHTALPNVLLDCADGAGGQMGGGAVVVDVVSTGPTAAVVSWSCLLSDAVQTPTMSLLRYLAKPVHVGTMMTFPGEYSRYLKADIDTFEGFYIRCSDYF